MSSDPLILFLKTDGVLILRKTGTTRKSTDVLSFHTVNRFDLESDV